MGDNQKIAKIKIRLEDKGFSDKTIDFVIDSLGYALSWNYMKMKKNLNQTDWTCSCGTVNTGNFCSNCGKSKPVPKESSDWTCSCGTVNSGNFCSNCGKSKPVPKESSDWTCSCGTVNTGNFCSNCGKQKGNQQSNSVGNVKIGDFVKFGNYPQTSNGDIQPIEWQVLAIENNKILVISKYGLEAKRFDRISNGWICSEIRQWLNDDFYNKAFNEQERKDIMSSNLSGFGGPISDGPSDNVFLLSYDEAEKYFANDEARSCKPTDYAKNNGANSLWSADDCSCWWLRSPFPYDSNYVYNVAFCGDLGYYLYVDKEDILVRPALWINI